MKKPIHIAEYLWLDGAKPTQQLRSKTRLIPGETGSVDLDFFPQWSFDGSSTFQAQGGDSDLLLQPVSYYPDPTRGEGHFLVMCEVLNPDGSPHESNTRARLRQLMEKGGKDVEAWIGYEQEYTLYQGRIPLGWPDFGYPAPQGPFYCSVGSEVAFGRDLAETHLAACLEAGLFIYGLNAEVMPGQWEFQIGYRGDDSEVADPLTCSDQLWVARWLIQRICEEDGVTASFDCKPVKGDWNGAGLHTNFSTKEMRTKGSGMAAIEKAMTNLEKRHMDHIKVYGAGLSERLTGAHETSPIDEFTWGIADRGRSIRIPRPVANNGYGYLEDRRPGANADPYQISTELLRSICEL